MRLKVVALGVEVGKMESLAKNRVGWLEAGGGGHLGKAGNRRKNQTTVQIVCGSLQVKMFYLLPNQTSVVAGVKKLLFMGKHFLDQSFWPRMVPLG